MSDATDEQLKRELLEMDVKLRNKQAGWETPKNVAVLAGASVTIAAAIGGLFGYKLVTTLAQPREQPPIIINMPAPQQSPAPPPQPPK